MDTRSAQGGFSSPLTRAALSRLNLGTRQAPSARVIIPSPSPNKATGALPGAGGLPRLCACGCGKLIPTGQTCPKRKPLTAHQRGYTSEWRKAAKAFLQRHPRCIECGEPATVVDHDRPHRGDAALFWAMSNWRPLCRHHHAVKAEDKSRDGGRGHSRTFASVRRGTPRPVSRNPRLEDSK